MKTVHVLASFLHLVALDYDPVPWLAAAGIVLTGMYGWSQWRAIGRDRWERA